MGQEHGSKDRGISLCHAYSLISVWGNVANSGRNFVLLRNPHGFGEWSGPWSDKSKEWNEEPEIAKVLSEQMPSREEDGLFVMEIKEFLEIFDFVDTVEVDMKEPKGVLHKIRPREEFERLNRMISAKAANCCAECTVL